MIVAIASAGSGQVPVEEFRRAVSASAAVTAFVNEYIPPKLEANYVGFDTGWTNHVAPDQGKEWRYDHDSPGLVQTLIQDPSQQRAAHALLLLEHVVSAPAPTWETLGGVTRNPYFNTPEAGRIVHRIMASVKTDGLGAQLELSEDNGSSIVILGTTNLPDTSDVYQSVMADFGVAFGDPAPRNSENYHELRIRLGDGVTDATSASIRCANLLHLEVL